MGKYPVYQSPLLDEVEKKMRPSENYLHAFLGNDPRKLITILNDDKTKLLTLGLTDEIIADRLKSITRAAEKGMGEPVLVEGKFEVRVNAARGKIPCPWPHPGLYPKTRIELRKRETGETLVWSHLAVHMIEEHGFYQGIGSPYRLDPADLKRILEL